jgi:hypothetical protein
MNQKKITRRDAIKRSAIAGAAVCGLVAAKPDDGLRLASTAEMHPVPPPVPYPAPPNYVHLDDMTVAVRNYYANRCPVLARFNWIPVERVDFLMYSHRYYVPDDGAVRQTMERWPAKGFISRGSSVAQYCETFRQPVPVGGWPNALTPRPAGIQSPFDFAITAQLQNLVDDIESALYYGVAQRPSPHGDDTIRARTAGLFTIIETNNFRQVENADAYRFDDFKRDTLVASRSNGGAPDLLLVATNFMSGFATWGVPIERPIIGETVFGTPIHAFESPELPGVTIVEAPLFRPYTAAALTSGEVWVRNKRNPCFVRRLNRNDPVEGDWIFEGAIDVANESHHAAVSGIRRFVV